MASLPHIFWFLLTNFAWRKNACSNSWSYFVRDVSSNCWASPDFGGLVPQTIERYIGKLETYNVTTDDGYILTLFRMPRDNPKGVVILQHPYVADSSTWFIHFNKSVALYFYNAGYDVWIPNNRNTRYSQSHRTLKSSDKAYWNFSFHEQGVYDHRADIKIIREKTGSENIYFVGHSLSTTTALIYASTYPEEAKESIKMFFLMGPVAQLKNIKTPIQNLAYILPVIQKLNDLRGATGESYNYGFLPFRLLRFAVINLPLQLPLSIIFGNSGGWNPTEFDPVVVNMLSANNPTLGSWKTLYHLAQLRNSRRFQMYDYGPGKNLQIYGAQKPPLYSLDKIKAPIFLMNFEKDSISVVKDLDNLYSSLPENVRAGKLIVPNMNHADVFIGKHNKERVLDKILHIFEKGE